MYSYKPSGVCSSKIDFLIEDNIIKDIKITGGCPGNSIGIRALCIDKTIDDVILKLEGIRCGGKNTSCPDQIAQALIQYKKDNN